MTIKEANKTDNNNNNTKNAQAFTVWFSLASRDSATEFKIQWLKFE